jgi:hypothetical protein
MSKHFTAKGITAHPRPVSKPHPPIWIGGNTAAARQRVTKYGDGWCPFPAPAVLAETARTAAMDSETLAAGIDDLRRRFDSAGRDWSGIDVSFTNVDGGSPGDDDFNADAYLAGLEKLAAVGVTWVEAGLPGDSLAHLLETIERFGKSVHRPRGVTIPAGTNAGMFSQSPCTSLLARITVRSGRMMAAAAWPRRSQSASALPGLAMWTTAPSLSSSSPSTSMFCRTSPRPAVAVAGRRNA